MKNNDIFLFVSISFLFYFCIWQHNPDGISETCLTLQLSECILGRNLEKQHVCDMNKKSHILVKLWQFEDKTPLSSMQI